MTPMDLRLKDPPGGGGGGGKPGRFGRTPGVGPQDGPGIPGQRSELTSDV